MVEKERDNGMSETQISLTDLRQQLASVINRAAFGGERIVLMSHGEPKAVIVGIAEWRHLHERAEGRGGEVDHVASALSAADQLQRHVAVWQTTNNIVPEPVEETLRLLREGHDDGIDRVR